ncbi:MAG: hypothetical protein ACRC56_06110 [Bosea sp. (in: a-proteobacteria)]
MTRKLALAALALVAASAVSFSVMLSAAPNPKVEQGEFLLPASEEYNTAACFAQSRDCGQIFADAWCESKGFAKAASFTLMQPMENAGLIRGKRLPPVKEPPVQVTCTRMAS